MLKLKAPGDEMHDVPQHCHSARPVERKVLGFKGGLFGIHTCCIHYRPSIWMIQSIMSSRELRSAAVCRPILAENGSGSGCSGDNATRSLNMS